MKWMNPLLFMVSVNIAVYIMAQASLYTSQDMSLPINPENILSMLGYDLTTVIAGAGVGVAVGGILAFITKQYVFAGGVLLIWVLGMIAPILQWVFAGLPMMLDAFGVPSYITWTVRGFMFFLFFMGLMEVAAQRQIS